ncbi:MAG TPA: MFS transporter [Dehalococcoidia bacterium]|nr:MFS transporter [Dehalococcoidia bacterium]
MDEALTSLPGLEAASYRRVLADRSFLLLWLSHAISQTAHSAILFTLLVLVAKAGTSLHSSLLVLAYVAPSLVLGLGAGTAVDRWPKATVLTVANGLRGLAALGFLLWADDLQALYGITLLFAIASQLFVPAAAAFIPSLVPGERLITANGLFHVTIVGAQFAGMVVLAPALIKGAGTGAVFALSLALFALTTVALRFLPHRQERQPDQEKSWRAMGNELWQGWQMLRRERRASLALFQLTIASSLVLLFAILIPRFMKDVLQLAPADAVFVFAPAGLGGLVGLRLLTWFDHRLGRERMPALGLAGIALFLLLFASLQGIATLMARTDFLDPFSNGRWGGISLLMALSMAYSFPIGLFHSLVQASAQTILHERAPAELRGRLFATQSILANALSLLPIILLGAIADLIGVGLVGVVVAGFMALAAGVSFFWGRAGAPSSSFVDRDPPLG